MFILLIFKFHSDFLLPVAVAGELVAPNSTDNEGLKKGKEKRVKQKTRRYLTEGSSESSDNEIGKNKESLQKKRNEGSKNDYYYIYYYLFYYFTQSSFFTSLL